MDGLRPQQHGRPHAKRSTAHPAGPCESGGGAGLPSAPGAQLDAELVRQTLATGPLSPPQQPQQRPSSGHNRNVKATQGRSEASAAVATTATAAASSSIAPQPFDVYVVLDFEATCEENRRLADPEVIEFPFVLVDARTARPVAEFQRYVKPVRHPTLSAFCTELTGITQDTVDGRPTFPAVYREALDFIARAGLGDAPPWRSYCVVTCGDWDLKVMLPAQMAVSGQQGVPASFQRWCNLKKLMGQLNLAPSSGGGGRKNGGAPSGMPEMLRLLGLPLQGRHHSGIDDCRNIASVLCELLKRGYVVDATYDPARSSSPSAQPTRWHAPLQQTDAAQLPALESLVSSLADGPDSTGRRATDTPPRTQTRKEKKPVPSTPTVGAAPPPPRRTVHIDTGRNAVEELLRSAAPSTSASSTFSPQEQKTISKFLSTLLRHKADQWRVPITANGYVLVADALRQPQVAQRHLTPQDIALLVRDSDKQRFRLAFGAEDGRLYIAAAQGHSMDGVEPELRVLTNPDEVPVAVHGTYWAAWHLIEGCGYMSTMTRQHIHFAKGLMHDGEVISGMRKDVQIFIYLDVPAVLADGVPLFESSNGVILTPGVGDTRQLPLKYVAKVVDRKSGRTVYPIDAPR
ncbi:putative phosphotransferase [Leptomonas pyrrhocoris]|uniref:2'-phosphotransferase n=1 Tax=Leptomonas pyrrhocoris TaxID=157538 RepID=A0A0M9FZK3_LEPPY|nr:putative phosphotransferase [Leptomonas pyrrhocoris]KPA79106.1 putative phosphotransferase [Leptomonas pyrrhocoris]|eukprot:XP_015657545.1 putative phosphotransferase [Leptomonas pyrrhocoris]